MSLAILKKALTALNLTLVAPVKWLPAIVTVFPTAPEAGSRERICGTLLLAMVKFTPLEIPREVVTVSRPVAAPLGTVAFIVTF